MMNLVLQDTIRIPYGVAKSLGAFRRWTKSNLFPSSGEYAYLNGELWVELSMETLLHNQLKSQIAAVLTLLVIEAARTGRFLGNRMRLVNEGAGISTEPDGMFVSHEAVRAGRVHWEQGPDSLEIIGTPDMVLEVVSSKSVQKDTVALRELYAAAEIAEYWLVNPLHGQLSFDILRLTAKGYVSSRKAAGWTKSAVFGKSFRLVQVEAGGDVPDYRLLVR